jgi:mRNA-degrading endonuclease RelE of RelBE toxin-antitoxin system
MKMEYRISIKRKIARRLDKLPEPVRKKALILVDVLRDDGPTGPHTWQNYSKLSENEYHCHLTHHYVACWRYEKSTIIIEVYYVGSREDAPY